MQIYGWGRYPRAEAKVQSPSSIDDCVQTILGHENIIPRGLARSYGDSSLASHVLSMIDVKVPDEFNSETGTLTCTAGTTFDEILHRYVPLGWFLPVTPGTRFITVGGAIASDVHGKNHHVQGAFSDHVREIELLLGNGDIVKTSSVLRSDLFRATCGGMGLTGVILAATFDLIPITSSKIVQTTIKLPNLEATLDAFEEYSSLPYSVAWIDSLATGKHNGKSIMFLGSHAKDDILSTIRGQAINIPIDLPAATLNPVTVKLFNQLYYKKARSNETKLVPLESFFYPLDSIGNWNRLYGKRGLLQYQCVIPKSVGRLGIKQLLSLVAESGQMSFLAVLKLFGKGNENYLSFPCEGYTLSLDFKVQTQSLRLLDTLDQLVLELGGKLYLAKDARMPESIFKSTYPMWEKFEQVRENYYAVGRFSSLQSTRLGLR